MDSDLASMWVSFFTAAGIPSEVAATYALTFAENRIQNDMLLDLNKEYLRDMGIKRMGDVIAILRHAKQVHENTARDRVLNTATTVNKVPVAAVTGRSTVVQPSSPASRIVGHYTRNVPSPSPPKRKSSEIEYGSDNDANIKKARLIRFAAQAKKAKSVVDEGLLNKQTVFSRLGSSEITKAVIPIPSATKPVFGRLGARPSDAEETALPYAGVLKATATRRVAVEPVRPTSSVAAISNKVTVNRLSGVQSKVRISGMHADRPIAKRGVVNGNRVDREFGADDQEMDEVDVVINNRASRQPISAKVDRTRLSGMRADQPPTSVRDKLSLPKSKSVKFSNYVEYKEIEAIQKVSLAKKIPKQTVFNKPERRLSMPEGADGVKARLGMKNINNLTITSNVYNRLGV